MKMLLWLMLLMLMMMLLHIADVFELLGYLFKRLNGRNRRRFFFRRFFQLR